MFGVEECRRKCNGHGVRRGRDGADTATSEIYKHYVFFFKCSYFSQFSVFSFVCVGV